ncbi:MAG: hypothetical protein HKM95_16245 [Inquilinus sp.]|nr:hypothetical protein [Inquilinus sp.]
MRHARHRRLVVAVDGVEAEIDSRGDDQRIEWHPPSASEPHVSGVGVDGLGAVMDQRDAVQTRQPIVVVGKRIQCAQAAENEVAVKAGDVAAVRFDQRDVDVVAAECHGTGDRGAPAPPPITTSLGDAA